MTKGKESSLVGPLQIEWSQSCSMTAHSHDTVTNLLLNIQVGSTTPLQG